MALRLRLDELKRKPMPNTKQYSGTEYIVGLESSESLDKDLETKVPTKREGEKGGEITEKNDESDEPRKKDVKITIEDRRKTSQIDRELILQRLTQKGVFTVTQTILPSQMPEPSKEQQKLIESVSEPEPEAEPEPEPEEEEEPPVKETKKKDETTDEKDEPKTKVKSAFVHEPARENVDLTKSKIGENIVSNMLPKPSTKDIILNASPYYLNNRKMFLQKLSGIFDKYKREIAANKAGSCEGSVSDSNESDDTNEAASVKLMTHQKVVRDYLNLYSPYRGLLLYHGLGSGKTCTSIAIAEGMKSQKHIFVMTLASLKANFFDQMKFCGDPIYRKNQHWEFVSTEDAPHYIPILVKALALTPESIKRRKGAWMVNVKKPANFQELADIDQKAVEQQLDEMIRAKYTDINYNGMTKRILDNLSETGSKNPFDHSVVIIDEAHNFVSRVVNKINDKTSLSYKLYDYLMNAVDARIVLLSGTPIINYPNEIGIMFNILRGYIKTWTFPVTLQSDKGQIKASDRPNKENIMRWFEEAGFKTYDYIEFSGDKLTITRNPFGFVNLEYSQTRSREKKGQRGGKTKRQRKSDTKKRTHKNRDAEPIDNGLVKVRHLKIPDLDEKDPTSEIYQEHTHPNQSGMNEKQWGGSIFEDYDGIELDETGNMSDRDFVDTIVKILDRHNLKVSRSKITMIPNKALPDNSKTFLDIFVEMGIKEIKNVETFKKRIVGLTSYFRSADTALMPSFVPSDHNDNYHLVKVDMSEYQFLQYEKIRKEEKEKEKKSRQRNAKGGAGGDAEDIFKTASSYRIASRLCCNFVFPDPPGRPRKQNGEYGGEEDIDLGVEGEGEEEQDKGKVEEPESDSESEKEMEGGARPKKTEEEKAETKRLRDEKKAEEKAEAKRAKDFEKAEAKKAKELEKAEAKKAKELEKAEAKRAKELEKAEAKRTKLLKKPPPPLKTDKEIVEPDTDEEKEEKIDDGLTYEKRIQNALINLKSREQEIFSPEGLKIYSPKFLKILENIQNRDHEGLHLIYSVFRSLEGIALLKMVLEANGFAHFKIKRDSAGAGGGGTWILDIKPEDLAKPKFTLYTGTETDEEKKIILNCYNGRWNEVPDTITSQFAKLGSDIQNNIHGDLIKVLMITASGAEGINLKNTRFVHIVEPFWHMVRIDQVIGRARRICSHQDLLEKMRNVQVFIYMATLTEKQRHDEKHKITDISKLYKKPSPVTKSKKPKDGKDGKDEVPVKSRLLQYTETLDEKPAIITMDEMLFENALIKDQVNSQILKAVKETAVDCRLYAKNNRDQHLLCYGGEKVTTNAFLSYPTLEQDFAEKDVGEVKQEKTRFVKIIENDKEYALNRDTKDVYEYENYLENLEDKNVELVRVGYVEKGRKGVEYIEFL
jgi:hypothetical protein